MSSTVRYILTFISAGAAAFAVIDPVGVPEWAQVTVAVLSAGLAAIGIVPPQMQYRGTRRYPPNDTPRVTDGHGDQYG